MESNNPESGERQINCLVCGSGMRHYFTKTFKTPWLDDVHYSECPECGFVASRTHFQLPAAEWSRLNEEYHGSYQGTDSAMDDPRWLERLNRQTVVIADMKESGLIPQKRPWVDYGCGDGKLPDFLKNRHGVTLLKYDRYMKSPGYLPDSDMKPGAFDFVIHTSVLEHMRDRATMDEIAGLVSETGVLGIHTLVMERIPLDPSWFYLLPVHCAFYSNESMSRLFKAWGFTSSIYHVEARLWLFFRGDPAEVEAQVARANARPGKEDFRYLFKRGFMDYWK